jgi:hypothetical protein
MFNSIHTLKNPPHDPYVTSTTLDEEKHFQRFRLHWEQAATSIGSNLKDYSFHFKTTPPGTTRDTKSHLAHLSDMSDQMIGLHAIQCECQWCKKCATELMDTYGFWWSYHNNTNNKSYMSHIYGSFNQKMLQLKATKNKKTDRTSLQQTRSKNNNNNINNDLDTEEYQSLIQEQFQLEMDLLEKQDGLASDTCDGNDKDVGCTIYDTDGYYDDVNIDYENSFEEDDGFDSNSEEKDVNMETIGIEAGECKRDITEYSCKHTKPSLRESKRGGLSALPKASELKLSKKNSATLATLQSFLGERYLSTFYYTPGVRPEDILSHAKELPVPKTTSINHLNHSNTTKHFFTLLEMTIQTMLHAQHKLKLLQPQLYTAKDNGTKGSGIYGYCLEYLEELPGSSKEKEDRKFLVRGDFINTSGQMLTDETTKQLECFVSNTKSFVNDFFYNKVYGLSHNQRQSDNFWKGLYQKQKEVQNCEILDQWAIDIMLKLAQIDSTLSVIFKCQLASSFSNGSISELKTQACYKFVLKFICWASNLYTSTAKYELYSGLHCTNPITMATRDDGDYHHCSNDILECPIVDAYNVLNNSAIRKIYGGTDNVHKSKDSNKLLTFGQVGFRALFYLKDELYEILKLYREKVPPMSTTSSLEDVCILLDFVFTLCATIIPQNTMAQPNREPETTDTAVIQPTTPLRTVTQNNAQPPVSTTTTAANGTTNNQTHKLHKLGQCLCCANKIHLNATNYAIINRVLDNVTLFPKTCDGFETGVTKDESMLLPSGKIWKLVARSNVLQETKEFYNDIVDRLCLKFQRQQQQQREQQEQEEQEKENKFYSTEPARSDKKRKHPQVTMTETEEGGEIEFNERLNKKAKTAPTRMVDSISCTTTTMPTRYPELRACTVDTLIMHLYVHMLKCIQGTTCDYNEETFASHTSSVLEKRTTVRWEDMVILPPPMAPELKSHELFSMDLATMADSFLY